MTAYSILGYRVVELNDQTTEIETVTLTINTWRGADTIDYRSDPDPDFPEDVSFNEGTWAAYIDGVSIADLAGNGGDIQADIEVPRVVWGGGNVTYVLRYGIEGPDQANDEFIDFLFAIGGAPLPLLTTPGEFDAFLAGIEDLSSAAVGSGFGPGEPIPLSGFAGIAGIGELTTSASNTIPGTEGVDIVEGDGGANLIPLGDGDDIAEGGRGNDTLLGERGNDELLGNVGADSLIGGFGADQLFGGAGDDSVFGEGGADLLNGGDDDDLLDGGDGNDAIFGGAGDDTLRGENGEDQLRGGGGDDRLAGGRKDDFLFAENGDDRLFGQRGNDTLDGGRGNDFLRGQERNDSLAGGQGRDTLDGGQGSDLLRGDAGSDTFVFDVRYGRDLIQDFEDNVDVIQLGSGLGQGLDGLSGQEIIDIYARQGDTFRETVFDFGRAELAVNVAFDEADSLANDLIVV